MKEGDLRYLIGVGIGLICGMALMSVMHESGRVTVKIVDCVSVKTKSEIK